MVSRRCSEFRFHPRKPRRGGACLPSEVVCLTAARKLLPSYEARRKPPGRIRGVAADVIELSCDEKKTDEPNQVRQVMNVIVSQYRSSAADALAELAV